MKTKLEQERQKLWEKKAFKFSNEFAEGRPQAFEHGSRIWQLITNPLSTFKDYTSQEKNWFSITGLKYDADHMADLWMMIQIQKQNNEKAFLKNENQA